jgi:pilus assembly protein Flp/PilA
METNMNSLMELLGRTELDSAVDWAIFRLVKDRSGVAAIEYGLIAALIAVAAVTIMGTVGTNLSSTFSTVASNL